MFAISPVVHSSVRPFIYPLPTCERHVLKTSEPISMQIGINLPSAGASGGSRGPAPP